jgi:hypothetical protein
MSNGRILIGYRLQNLQKIAEQMLESDNSPVAVDTCEEEKGLLAFRRGIESFARSSEAAILVREMVERFHKGVLRLEVRGNALVLAESKYYVLTLSSIESYTHRKQSLIDESAGNVLTSHASSSLLVNLGNQDLHLFLHKICSDWREGIPGNPNAIPDDGARVVRLPPGEAIYLDAKQYIPDLQESDTPIVLARLSSKSYEPLACSIDRYTGQFRMFSCGVPSVARVPLSLKLMRAMILAHEERLSFDDVEKCLITMERYCSDSLHFIRWAAIQSLASVDLMRAKKHILKATNDPHPHVRRAAISAVNVLGIGG